MTNQDLIRQYVDTGLSIPEYQFNKLSGNLKKTYLRKRLIAYEQDLGWNDNDLSLEDYEFRMISDDEKRRYVENRVKKHLLLSDFQYEFLPWEMKEEYADVYEYEEQWFKWNDGIWL